jgi:hypothetical protein
MRALGLCILLMGCGDTGQKRVSYPILGAGAGGEFTVGDWTVTLEVGRVAIGPIYFCATEAASSSLCSVAVNEFADVAEFDALSMAEQPIGEVRGVTGQIRSTTYDWGINWFPRQGQPTPAEAAPGGHSAHFEGTARRGAESVRFEADIDVPPTLAGTLAVQGLRVTPTVDVQNSALQLTVSVDPRAWWAQVDFDELAAAPMVEPGSRAYSALSTAMRVGTPPRFEWR